MGVTNLRDAGVRVRETNLRERNVERSNPLTAPANWLTFLNN